MGNTNKFLSNSCHRYKQDEHLMKYYLLPKE